MKQGLNIFITGLLLWLSSRIFPNIVMIDGLAPLILATVIFYVAVLISSALCVLFFMPVLSRNAPVKSMFVVAFIITAIIGALVLAYICPLLDGFFIGGFWFALILSAIAGALSFRAEVTIR